MTTSYKGDLLFFLLTFFNFITDVFSYYKNKMSELIELYNNLDRGKWVFNFDTNPSVLPLEAINHNENTISDKWLYDSVENKLTYAGSSNIVKHQWLSAEIIEHIDINLKTPNTHIINLDKFLESFKLYTDHNNPPTLQHIILCISIKYKKWFSTKSDVKLIIIDDMGNDIHLDIFTDITCLTINKNNKLEISLDKNNTE